MVALLASQIVFDIKRICFRTEVVAQGFQEERESKVQP